MQLFSYFMHKDIFHYVKTANLEMIKFMLLKNINLQHSRNKDGLTILQFMTTFKWSLEHIAIYDFIIVFSNVNEVDKNGNTALLLSLLNKHSDIFERLIINSQVDRNAVNNDGDTAWHICAKNGCNFLERYRLVLNIISPNKAGDTPLHIIVKNNRHSMVKFVLNQDTRNIKNQEGLSPLALAVKDSLKNMILTMNKHLSLTDEELILINSKNLFNNGNHYRCDPNLQELFQKTIISTNQLYYLNGMVVINSLDIPLNFVTDKKLLLHTLFMCTKNFITPIAIQILIHDKSLVNMKTEGMTIMDYAIKCKNEEIINILHNYCRVKLPEVSVIINNELSIEKRFNKRLCNIPDKDGNIPIQTAIINQNYYNILMLLKHSNLHHKNKANHNSYDLANKSSNKNIQKILQSQ